MALGEHSRFATLTSAKARANLSQVEPRERFTLAYHPRQWFADIDEGRLLPRLTPITHTAGVNGATHEDPEAGLYDMTRQCGYQPLPVTVTEGMEGGPQAYLVSTVVARGTHWHTYWETPIPGATRSRTDLAGYRAFLAYLVDSGNVPAVEEHVVEDRINSLSRQRDEARRRAGTDPVEADRAARIEAEIAVWRKAIEPDPIPESKPRRSRKAAAQE